jgi:hypothetical protein
MHWENPTTQKRRRRRVDSWRFRRRSTGLLVRATGACLSGTCRDDPIPVGVYWLDVIYEEALQTPGVRKDAHFALWLQTMQGLGWVKVLRVVQHEGVILSDDPPRDWILFEVLSPAPRWTPATGLGLPTVAPQGIQTTEEDTIQSPAPEGFWDKLLPESKLGKAAVITAAVAATGLVLYGLTRS